MKFSACRRTGVITTTGVLVSGSLLATSAQAVVSSADNNRIATTMDQALGSRSAGAYLDAKTGKLVVTVTSQSDATTVRKAGGVPKMVARSGAQLNSIKSDLDRTARVSGTAWGIDPKADQVVVTIDSTVTGAKLAKVTAAAKKHGAAVRIKHIPGVIRFAATGGDAIWSNGGGSRCSLGFNVQDGSGKYFFLTAGHCGIGARDWYADQGQSTLLGRIVKASFPGTDYALAEYASGVNHPGTVGNQEISDAGAPYVGQSVSKRGSSTGTNGGTVTALDVTVTDGVSVYHETETNACALGGDSGGAFYTGSTALGIISASSDTCSDPQSWFQNVQAALSAYGVHVY